MSARFWHPNGPAMICENSSTRMPLSGPRWGEPSWVVVIVVYPSSACARANAEARDCNAGSIRHDRTTRDPGGGTHWRWWRCGAPHAAMRFLRRRMGLLRPLHRPARCSSGVGRRGGLELCPIPGATARRLLVRQHLAADRRRAPGDALRRRAYDRRRGPPGDFDGDGAIDLIVTRMDGHDLLFRNRGGGRVRG